MWRVDEYPSDLALFPESEHETVEQWCWDPSTLLAAIFVFEVD